MGLDAYKLEKWSRMIRIRDLSICQLCQEGVTARRLMQAHHIETKSTYPEIAYNLDNGICLCSDCHLRIVHSTDDNPKMFRVIFKRWVSRVENNKYNVKYQCKLTG